MNLIVFPTKHENPFPVRVTTGKVTKMNDKILLGCSGIGSAGVLNLGRILEEYPEINTVCEFGAAASVSKGEIGGIYECTTFCDSNGGIIASSHSFTNLPTAAVTGDDRIYTGNEYDWADLLEMPLLYTMETLRFRNITLEFKKHFFSIRIVSDNGCGNIMEQVVQEISKAKKQIGEILSVFADITL